MRRHLSSAFLALFCLVAIAIGEATAQGVTETDPAEQPAGGLMAFGCPASFKGMNLLTGDANVGKTRQIANQPTYAFLCRYAGTAGTAEWDARWDEGNSTSATKCGIADERGASGAGIPYAYVYSQSKAAYLYVGGRAATVDEMIALGRPHLQEAEGKAKACTQAPAPPKCPTAFNALPFSQSYPSNGVVRELPNGTWNIICYYAMDRLGGVSLQTIWFQKPDPLGMSSTCGMASRGSGLREAYVEYSRTKEAYFTVSTTPGTNVNVYPATVDEIKAAGRALLTAAESLAIGCVTRSGAAAPAAVSSPAPAAVAPATATTPTVIVAVSPDANVLPDEAYQEPGTVGQEGLAASVLAPGSALPGASETAAAGVAVAAGAAAVGASELSRRRRNPVAGIAGEVIRDRVSQIPAEEARRILRRALPRDRVDLIDNPVGALTSIAGAALNPERLPATLRETLVNEPRLAQDILVRRGISPPLIAALGGPGRVIKLIERIGRNPPRAIAAGIKDALHNLSHPKELVRHIGHAVERVVEATPIGPVLGLLKHLFRRRHRHPRPAAQSTQRISDVTNVESAPLQAEPSEAMQDPYPHTENDTPASLR